MIVAFDDEGSSSASEMTVCVTDNELEGSLRNSALFAPVRLCRKKDGSEILSATDGTENKSE